jgi:hypothetical protein
MGLPIKYAGKNPSYNKKKLAKVDATIDHKDYLHRAGRTARAG